MIILFSAARILDMLSTSIAFSMGMEELNPFSSFLLKQNIILFIAVQLLLLLAIIKLLRHRLIETAVKIFIPLNVLVVISNIVLVVLEIASWQLV